MKDTPVRMVGICRDTTKRREAEEALRRNEQELKLADRRKDEFLATLSHELRNVLTPIAVGSQLLASAQADTELTEQATTVIHRQVGILSRLVDDLLDASRIAEGKLDLRRETVDLSAVLGTAIEMAHPLIAQLGHELLVELPTEAVRLDADPVRLAQVFTNLLNNAAKYTDRGGRIHLSAVRDGQLAVVSVRDSGIGIPPGVLPHIFEMFMQTAPGHARTRGGLGIGLTLVKRLVEMHGGAVHALSDGNGNGSEFIVRLPVVVQPADGLLQAHARAADRARIVDDSA